MKNKNLIISIIAILVLAAVISTCIILKNSNSSASKSSDTQQNAPSKSEEQKKSIFNSSYDIYLGSYINGLRVKQLLTTIKANNEKDNGRKVEAVTDDGAQVDFSTINNSHTYNIRFEYDNDGYITKAIIKEN